MGSDNDNDDDIFYFFVFFLLFVWGGVNFQFFQNLHPGEEHAAWGEAR